MRPSFHKRKNLNQVVELNKVLEVKDYVRKDVLGRTQEKISITVIPQRKTLKREKSLKRIRGIKNLIEIDILKTGKDPTYV